MDVGAKRRKIIKRVGWENLHPELLTDIAWRLDDLANNIRFSAVCKSWNSVASEVEAPWLPSSRDHPHPWLLLAQDIGADFSRVISEINNINSKEDEVIADEKDYPTSSNIRGLFSLATEKIYDLDLPEARDKFILGTNKGWLVTLGRDLRVNLLHPLLRDQIPLPSLPTPCEYQSDKDFARVCHMFISKVVLSSGVPTKSALLLLQHQGSSHHPIIMVIYDQTQKLGFSRLGDNSWTFVELDSKFNGIEDIVYHKEKFYAISFRGTIFVCDPDNNDKKERQHNGAVLTSIPIATNDLDQCYMVESLCGSHIWVVFRIREGTCYSHDEVSGQFKYRTINFVVLKLQVHYPEKHDVPSCTWEKQVKHLGNQALFIGKASSKSVASSDLIKSNSIYFTDDSEYLYSHGRGHDMGIFNLETRKIQPHYQGMSIHTFSPPFWYI